MKIVAMYNLKESAKMEEFKKWSKEVDQATVLKQPGFRRFDVFEAAAVLKGSKPPYKTSGSDVPFDIIEFTEVESQEALERSQTSSVMSNVMRKWLEFVEESSVTIIRVEQL